MSPATPTAPIRHALYVRAARAYAPAYGHIAAQIGLDAGAFLDVGCGPGWLAIGVAAGRPEVDAIGIDPSGAMNRAAEANRGPRLNVTFRQMPASRVVYPDHTFDAAAVVHAAEVWAETPAVLAELHRVLKDGGKCYIYEPDPDGDIPKGWITRRRGWPPDAWLRRVWRSSCLDSEGWNELKSAIKQSPFGGGQEDRHGFYRRLVLTR